MNRLTSYKIIFMAIIIINACSSKDQLVVNAHASLFPDALSISIRVNSLSWKPCLGQMNSDKMLLQLLSVFSGRHGLRLWSGNVLSRSLFWLPNLRPLNSILLLSGEFARGKKKSRESAADTINWMRFNLFSCIFHNIQNITFSLFISCLLCLDSYITK